MHMVAGWHDASLSFWVYLIYVPSCGCFELLTHAVNATFDAEDLLNDQQRDSKKAPVMILRSG